MITKLLFTVIILITVDNSYLDSNNPVILPSFKPTTSPPIIRPIAIVNSSLPVIMSMSWILLQKLVGSMNMNLIIKHIDKIARDTVVAPNLGQNPMKGGGDITIFPKR